MKMYFGQRNTVQRLRKKLRDKAEMAASDSSTSTPYFKMKENVLCFYGALLYEGKVMRIRSSKTAAGVEYEYLIHYIGWKKHWDEWVPKSRLLEITVRNRQRMTDLRIEYENKLSDSNETKRKLRKRKSRRSRPTSPLPCADNRIAAPAVPLPIEPPNVPNEGSDDEVVILNSSFSVDNKQPENTSEGPASQQARSSSENAVEVVPYSITKLCSVDDSLIMKILNLAQCDTVDFTSAFGNGNNSGVEAGSTASEGAAGPSSAAECVAGPSTAVKCVAGPSSASEYVAGPSTAAQCVAGPSTAAQCVAGPSTAAQCVAGPSNANASFLADPNVNVRRQQDQCGLTFVSTKKRKPLNTRIKVEKDGDGTTTISIKIKRCSQKKFGGRSGPEFFRLGRVDPKEKLINNGSWKVEFFLPAGLESVLRQDLENTTKRGRVVKLPADYSITDILDDFLTSEGHKSEHVADVCDVFHQAFHKIIGCNLLFKEEEGQYLQIMRKLATPEWKDKSICDMYGSLHLLRLHIVLSGVLRWSSDYGNKRAVELDFFRLPVFLWKNRQTYFVNLYEPVE